MHAEALLSYARWRSTIERAALSVEERWVRAVPRDEEAARVSLGLAQWWLEEGKTRYATRYALAAQALDPDLWRQVDTLLGRLSVKARVRLHDWLVAALVEDLEGGAE
jgi:hypothetical protein